MTDLFAPKKHVSMFFTNKQSELKYTELLTYCYRSHQASYGTVPSHRRTAKATGMKEETIATASARLQQFGLLDGDYRVISPCPKKQWFQESEALLERFIDEHFSRWYRNWKCFVRQPGRDNPLTVPCVMLYSLIINSAKNEWKPPHGWSIEYLALITGITPKTVSSSLGRLEEYGFLSILDGMRFRLYKLTSSQLECFAGKRAYSGASSEPDEIADEFSPASRILDAKAQAKKDLADFINRWPIGNKDKDRVFKDVTQMKEWPNGWKKAADQIIERIMERDAR